jgi:hypothetical protein
MGVCFARNIKIRHFKSSSYHRSIVDHSNTKTLPFISFSTTAFEQMEGSGARVCKKDGHSWDQRDKFPGSYVSAHNASLHSPLAAYMNDAHVNYTTCLSVLDAKRPRKSELDGRERRSDGRLIERPNLGNRFLSLEGLDYDGEIAEWLLGMHQTLLQSQGRDIVAKLIRLYQLLTCSPNDESQRSNQLLLSHPGGIGRTKVIKRRLNRIVSFLEDKINVGELKAEIIGRHKFSFKIRHFNILIGQDLYCQMTVDGEPCEHKGQRRVSERWVCGNHSTFVSEFGTQEIEQDSTDQEALLLLCTTDKRCHWQCINGSRCEKKIQNML